MWKNLLCGTVSLFICSQSIAAFTLNSTRYIYNQGQKNITVEVNNNTEKTYGGQVWIENVNKNDSKVYMVGQPPFFKISPKGKQLLRIMNVDTSLPEDRESLFWLNVQEVPPKPATTEGNVLAIAMNTKVKLFYRPKTIEAGRDGAEKKLQLIQKDGSSWLKNPTPYYFAVLDLKIDGKPVNLTDSVRNALAQLAPFGEVKLNKLISGTPSVNAINDWGGTQDWSIIMVK